MHKWIFFFFWQFELRCQSRLATNLQLKRGGGAEKRDCPLRNLGWKCIRFKGLFIIYSFNCTYQKVIQHITWFDSNIFSDVSLMTFLMQILMLILYSQNSLTKPPEDIDSPGRSGARMMMSMDKKYFIKTLVSEEVEQLHLILKQYHQVCTGAD